jgi:hypothetical protein
MLFYLTLFASFIVIALAAIAVYLHWKIRVQTKKAKALQAEQDAKTAEKILQIQKDVQFIAKAYLSDQVELSEASLRIHHLVNCIGLSESQRATIAAFDAVATQIKDIPTHQAWKDLTKEEQKNFRNLFNELENKHGNEAKRLAKPLANGELISPN